jgi:dsRNA-specific ribonuclease
MLHKFIMTGALEKGKWLPSCMTFKESTGLKNDDGLSSKVYADIIEALLGLVFLECGWDVARKVRFDFLYREELVS